MQQCSRRSGVASLDWVVERLTERDPRSSVQPTRSTPADVLTVLTNTARAAGLHKGSRVIEFGKLRPVVLDLALAERWRLTFFSTSSEPIELAAAYPCMRALHGNWRNFCATSTVAFDWVICMTAPSEATDDKVQLLTRLLHPTSIMSSVECFASPYPSWFRHEETLENAGLQAIRRESLGAGMYVVSSQLRSRAAVRRRQAA